MGRSAALSPGFRRHKGVGSFLDNFNRADQEPLGAGWFYIARTFRIVNNRAQIGTLTTGLLQAGAVDAIHMAAVRDFGVGNSQDFSFDHVVSQTSSFGSGALWGSPNGIDAWYVRVQTDPGSGDCIANVRHIVAGARRIDTTIFVQRTSRRLRVTHAVVGGSTTVNIYDDVGLRYTNTEAVARSVRYGGIMSSDTNAHTFDNFSAVTP